MVQGIKNKDIKKVENILKKLVKRIKKIQKYNPESYLFCNMDFLELHGCFYDEDEDFNNAEAVVSVCIPQMSGGERGTVD